MTEAAGPQARFDCSQSITSDGTPPGSPVMRKTVLRGISPPRPLLPNSIPPTCFPSDDDDYELPQGPIDPGTGFLIHHMGDGCNPAIAQNATVTPLPPIHSLDDDEECVSRDSTPTAHSQAGELLPNDQKLKHIAVDVLQHVLIGYEMKTDPVLNGDTLAAATESPVRDERTGLDSLPVVGLSKTHSEHPMSRGHFDAAIMAPGSAGLPPISPDALDNGTQTLPSLRKTFPGIELSPIDNASMATNCSDPGSGSSLAAPPSLHHIHAMAGDHATVPADPNGTTKQSSPQDSPVARPFSAHSGGIALYGNAVHAQFEAQKGRSVISIPIPQGTISQGRGGGKPPNAPKASYVCTHPGCKTAPFSTQYLLDSHANVHSSARPHYCPVRGCPNAEGGQGFKRKNEMRRHGLSHESPGYRCPFCPHRNHKYPRPDNLQRHITANHGDKRDDPALRMVLAQRPDGVSRGRRRRG